MRPHRKYGFVFASTCGSYRDYDRVLRFVAVAVGFTTYFVSRSPRRSPRVSHVGTARSTVKILIKFRHYFSIIFFSWVLGLPGSIRMDGCTFDRWSECSRHDKKPYLALPARIYTIFFFRSNLYACLSTRHRCAALSQKLAYNIFYCSFYC